MAIRALKHNEVYALARNEKFVATVQSAALHKAIYLYDLHKADIEAGNFSTLTNQVKAEWNFSASLLWAGALVNNTGFARLFAEYLLNDAAGIAVPEDGNGSEIFSPQQITDIMVTDGIISRDNASFGKAWQAFLETVGIDTPVTSWING